MIGKEEQWHELKTEGISRLLPLPILSDVGKWAAIALYLNEHGVPTPTAYRRMKGLPVSSAVADDPMWGARMIHEILTNPIYTGDLVQGRRRVKSYKVHQIEAVPEEEWVRVPDTHEAIISHPGPWAGCAR